MSDQPALGVKASGPKSDRPGQVGGLRSWSVLELLRWTTDYFKRVGIDSARLDAEVLLAHALEMDRLTLYVDYERPVQADERSRFRALIQRRARDRVPVSLLLGKREFWSLEFCVTRDVLTPRPETDITTQPRKNACASAPLGAPASAPWGALAALAACALGLRRRR